MSSPSDFGRAAFGIAGAVIGGYFGGPLGASIGFAIGNFVGGQLFGDDQSGGPTVEGPRLNDLTVSGSTYGKGIPIVYGGVRVPGNIIWATDIIEVKHEAEVEGGGGKGGPSPPGGTEVTYEYFGNFAMVFAAGPVEAIRKIWANGKLLVDLSDDPGKGEAFLYGSQHYRIYLGTETQMPDPLIEADRGVGNVPAHRGLAYVVFEELPLEDFGGRLPASVSAEVVSVAPDSFAQEDASVGSHLADFTTMDFSAPFFVTTSTVGITMVKVNRLTGTEYFRFNTNADPDSLASIPSNINGLGVAASAVDPINGDITVGMEGTTFAGGGIAVYDKNGKFVKWLHLGQFGAPRHSLVFGADGGLTRTLIVMNGLQGDRLNTFKWSPDPADPLDTRGKLTGPIEQFEAPTAYFSFAVDPTKGVERAWGMRDTTGSGPPAIIEVGGDASIGTDTTIGGITSRPVAISYDTVTNTLLVSTASAVYKLDPDTYAILDQVGDGVPASDGGNTGYSGTAIVVSWRNSIRTVKGLLHIFTTREVTDPGSSINLVRINTLDLSIVRRYNSISLFNPDAIWTTGVVWDPLFPAVWSTAGTYTKFLLDRYASNGVPLADILTDLSGRGGLGPTDIDVTSITDTVEGYVIDSPTSIRGAVQPLQQAFFFDGAEINFKLTYVKRGGAVQANVPFADLAAKVEGQGDEPKISDTRKQEAEVPRRVLVSYLNKGNDYMVSTQMEQRIFNDPNQSLVGSTQSRQETNYRLPIVMTDQQAREAASVSLGMAWTERTNVSFKLPPKWLRLDPTDNITVEKITNELTTVLAVRLTQVEIGDGGILACRGVLTDTAVFFPNVTGTPSPINKAKPIPTPVASEMFLLNLPNLLGLADEGGSAWLASSPAYQVPVPDWHGTSLSRAIDSGGPFVNVAAVINPITWGLIKTPFGSTDRPTVFDEKNVLEVELVFESALVGATDFQIFSGNNLVFIPSTGELLHFGTAVQISATRWELSHLLRGRYGTDTFVSAAGTNEKVVFIDTARMAKFGDVQDAGFIRYYIGTTIATKATATPVTSFINNAESLKPWPPSQFEATRGPANDLIMVWQRRTRYNGELKDLIEVPLNESFERYEIDIVRLGVVVRTISIDSAETTTYSAANQATDGFIGGDPIQADLYQMSETIGRGNPRTKIF